MDNSLRKKEINFKWFGNHLKNIFVKGNQAGGLEKYLLLLLCSNKENIFPLRNLKAWLPHILQASPKSHLSNDTLPPTLFKTVTLLQLPYALFAFLKCIYYQLTNYIFHYFIASLISSVKMQAPWGQDFFSCYIPHA